MSTDEGKHEPHIGAQPGKPVLKDQKMKKKKERKALTWDEHAIEEHDLLRGTRMKIDEPNTPYHYDNLSHSDCESESSFRSINNTSSNEGGGGGGAINWNHLSNKLGAVAAAQMLSPPSPSASLGGGSCSGGNSSGAESDVEKNRKRRNLKKKEFQLHRKAHYNEMEAVRRWRQEHQDDDDDEDDE